MTDQSWPTIHIRTTYRYVRTGFTLVELLTVMFVVSVLIAILVPAVTSARRAAKNVETSAIIRGLETGLDQFKTDNGREYPQTNGYPPSFSHPTIGTYTFDPLQGQYPFLPAAQGNNPKVYGAQWLVAMLLGQDGQGFISRNDVPPNQKNNPNQWYDQLINATLLPRRPLYVAVQPKQLRPTERIPGSPAGGKASPTLFPNWAAMKNMPVFVDSFDQPILYYAANKFAKAPNHVEAKRNPNNWNRPEQPYYFHEDNEGFTGVATSGGSTTQGWNFLGTTSSPTQMLHRIARPGNELNAMQLSPEGIEASGGEQDSFANNQNTFAYYILDRRALAQQGTVTINSPVRPIRPQQFILISAGADGRYGTNDDVNNLGSRSIDE